MVHENVRKRGVVCDADQPRVRGANGHGDRGDIAPGNQKPWAIDTAYFSPSRKPLYLLAMAVAPAWQRRGIGRRCLEEAKAAAQATGADAIRFDAYEAKAGAGEFYAICGCAEKGRVRYRGVPLIYYEILLAANGK